MFSRLRKLNYLHPVFGPTRFNGLFQHQTADLQNQVVGWLKIISSFVAFKSLENNINDVTFMGIIM